MKKIFELQTNLDNYTYPLTKIVISMLIILFSVFRKSLFIISIKPLNFLLTLFCLISTMASILCVYIAIPELFYVWKNRKAKREKIELIPTIPFDVEQVICLIKENDIIEFEIKANESKIKVGSSSTCKVNSSVFFDKRFFIGELEYLTAEEFKKELLKYAIDKTINVISVDGVKAEKW